MRTKARAAPVPRRLFALPVLILLSAAFHALSAGTLPLQELCQGAARYYGQRVNVEGIVGTYEERVSTRGIAYTIFRLDEECSVFVFAGKRQGLREGLRVKVTGTFEKRKDIDSAVVHITLGPEEDTDVDFGLANRLIRDGVCCACGYFRFAWNVRNPYPRNARVVEFFNERHGVHRSYGALPKGQGDADVCTPIVAVNRTMDRLLIDIPYTVGIFQMIDAQRIETRR